MPGRSKHRGIRERLEQALKAGENEQCEFRRSFGEETLRTLCALANTHGGEVWVGVDDDGRIAGISFGRESARDWANQIGQGLGLNARIEPVEVEGKTVVRIAVSESQWKPIRYRGRAWVRVGNSDRQATDEEETRWVLERVGTTWDALPETRARLEDLDPDAIQRFRRLCNVKGRRSIPPEEDDATVLRKLGLLTESGEVTRAAVLLFGKEPQRFYSHAFVRIGRFRTPTFVVDDHPIYGTLWEQVDGAMNYCRQHLQTSYGPTPEPAREVLWEYPLEALREAIINAVCHRNYVDPGHTQVRWFDDSMVILSPGTLVPPLRPEDLKRPHRSYLRNPKIAEAFYFAGWIEQWGTGIRKILDEFRQAGLPEPEWEEAQGAVWLTFRKDLLTEEHLKARGLNERQIRAVLWVKTHGSITNSEYQALVQVSKRTASDDLRWLEKAGLLERVGTTGKGTHYRLKGRQRGERGNKGAIKGQNKPFPSSTEGKQQ